MTNEGNTIFIGNMFRKHYKMKYQDFCSEFSKMQRLIKFHRQKGQIVHRREVIENEGNTIYIGNMFYKHYKMKYQDFCSEFSKMQRLIKLYRQQGQTVHRREVIDKGWK